MVLQDIVRRMPEIMRETAALVSLTEGLGGGAKSLMAWMISIRAEVVTEGTLDRPILEKNPELFDPSIWSDMLIGAGLCNIGDAPPEQMEFTKDCERYLTIRGESCIPNCTKREIKKDAPRARSSVLERKVDHLS